MGSVRLGVGTEWLLDGRAFRVVRQSAAGRFVARDLKFQLEKTFSESEVLTLYAGGRLRFAIDGEARQETPSQETAARIVDDLSQQEQQELQRRWEAIEPLTKLTSGPTARDYRQRAAELIRIGKPCSARSLRRYVSAWKRAGRARLALVPSVARRGNRGRARRSSLL